MTFESITWLYLTPLLVVMAAVTISLGLRKRDALLSRFAAARLLDQLTEKASMQRTWLKAILVVFAFGLTGLALSRPQFGTEWSERKARGLDIVFALDSSKSMLATDLRPTRLDRAKLAIIDLLERLESDRIGLVSFSGRAFLQTPPTLDYSAFRESLEIVDPSMMTEGGSDIGFALAEAAKAFPTESNVKVIILLTDGEDLGGQALKAAEDAANEGIKVYSIGIGTPEGEYLKVRNSDGIDEFIRDSNDQPVRSQLDEITLQQIAQSTGGSYSRLSGESLDTLYTSVLANLPREERESELLERRIDRYQWPLAAAVICLILDLLIRRRRNTSIAVAILVLIASTGSPTESLAQEKTAADPISEFNAANDALLTNDYAKAIELYESALKLTEERQLQGSAIYNLAHAQYQSGRAAYQQGDPQAALESFKQSEASFQSAAEIDHTNESIYEDLSKVTQTREMIEKLLEEQEPQDSESEQSEDSEENSDDSEQQESDDSEQQEGDNSEQQEGDDSEQSEQNEDQSQQQESGEQSEEDSQSQDSEGNESEQDQQSENSESSEESSEDESEADPSNETDEEGAESEADEQEAASEGDEEGSEDSNSAQSASSLSEEDIAGMKPQEAIMLLDSLRDKEELLPFIDQRNGGRPREIKDW